MENNMVKMEQGKEYKTRGGEKVTCTVIANGVATMSYDYNVWADNGKRNRSLESVYDIVSEWANQVPLTTLTAEDLNVNKWNNFIINIEEGKEYLTRDGDRVKCLSINGDIAYLNNNRCVFADDGKRSRNFNDQYDVISECEDQDKVELSKYKMVRAKSRYGYLIASFGEYSWVDTGGKAPVVFRTDCLEDVQHEAYK